MSNRLSAEPSTDMQSNRADHKLLQQGVAQWSAIVDIEARVCARRRSGGTLAVALIDPATEIDFHELSVAPDDRLVLGVHQRAENPWQ